MCVCVKEREGVKERRQGERGRGREGERERDQIVKLRTNTYAPTLASLSLLKVDYTKGICFYDYIQACAYLLFKGGVQSLREGGALWDGLSGGRVVARAQALQ